MGTVHNNYFVSNEYWLNEKPYLHEALDLVTLPIRIMMGGSIVDLRGRCIQVQSHIIDLPFISPILRIAAFVISAYFYRFSSAAAGAMVLKYFFEASLVRSELMQIELRENEKPSKEVCSISLDTTGLAEPKGLHPYKSSIYNEMKGSQSSIEDKEIRLAIYPFDRAPVKNYPAFPKFCPKMTCQKGFFSYPKSTERLQQWTASFSASEPFDCCTSEDLTQNALQVMEHPGLYHVKSRIEESRSEMRELCEDQIALVTGARRYGQFVAEQCYGKEFASSGLEFVKSLAIPFTLPVESRIFCMAAPLIPSSEKGKPYSKEVLEALFYRSFHAFTQIKRLASPQAIQIHTGNWGCEMMGHHPRAVALMQIAAAHAAGVHYFDYYPLDAKEEWTIVWHFYETMRSNHRKWTVDEFLTNMAIRARDMGCVYQSNDDTI